MTVYKKQLNFDLAQYTTGHLRDLLLNLIKCDRRENQPLTQSMIENDARELHSGKYYNYIYFSLMKLLLFLKYFLLFT